MIKKLQALKNKKGFTLVELIIVLVILAILAALLLPTLTGYIDKANEMKVESACRMAVMATKAEVGEAYGKLTGGTQLTAGATLTVSSPTVPDAKSGQILDTDLMKLAEFDNAAEKSYSVEATVTTDGTLESLLYKNVNYDAEYKDGAFKVTKKTTANTFTANSFVVKVKS